MIFRNTLLVFLSSFVYLLNAKEIHGPTFVVFPSPPTPLDSFVNKIEEKPEPNIKIIGEPHVKKTTKKPLVDTKINLLEMQELEKMLADDDKKQVEMFPAVMYVETNGGGEKKMKLVYNDKLTIEKMAELVEKNKKSANQKNKKKKNDDDNEDEVDSDFKKDAKKVLRSFVDAINYNQFSDFWFYNVVPYGTFEPCGMRSFDAYSDFLINMDHLMYKVHQFSNDEYTAEILKTNSNKHEFVAEIEGDDTSSSYSFRLTSMFGSPKIVKIEELC